MNACNVIVVLLLSLFYSTAVHGVERNAADDSGIAFEVLFRLDRLHLKLVELESRMQKHRESIEKKLDVEISQLNQTIDKKLNGVISALNRSISQNAITQSNIVKEKIQETTDQTLAEVKDTLYKHILWANHEQMRKEIQTVKSNEDFARLRSQSGAHLRLISLKSCKENPSKQDGKYILQSDTTEDIFIGYCSHTRFGGGWLEIQYRSSGSVNFTRNWTEYRKGFGDYGGEQWIGLELLHRLTSARPYELYVYLKDFDGNSKYARYSEFEIGSETEQYALKKLGGYSGTAGDSLASHKGMKFSTWDRDNDLDDRNCASSFKGGWWYKKCYHSNLNGLRSKGNDWKNIVWTQFSSSDVNMGLAISRMYIREK